MNLTFLAGLALMLGLFIGNDDARAYTDAARGVEATKNHRSDPHYKILNLTESSVICADVSNPRRVYRTVNISLCSDTNQLEENKSITVAMRLCKSPDGTYFYADNCAKEGGFPTHPPWQ